MDKVTILLPTYNDADFIERTLDSVKFQTYKNWELLICDDGSSDNTNQIVKKYIKKYKLSDKIKYYYQDNADQLNAIINVLNYATGDFAYILHSDDLLNDKNTLKNCIDFFKKNKDCQVIISDLNVINNDDKIVGAQKVENYCIKDYIQPLQLLWLGRNLYNDFPFAKMEVFKKQIYTNYLIWNCPFWLDVDDNKMLNVQKVDFVIRKYRVNDDNYLANPNARYNVVNGEIRTVTNLLSSYNIYFYKIQYIIFRIFNKLKLYNFFRPLYKKCETKNKYKIINFVLHKRFSKNEIKGNIFLNSLIGFFKNKNNRIIKIDKIDKTVPIYYGKDMRIFNKKIINNCLEDFYVKFLKEMEKGFSIVIVKNKRDKEKIEDIAKFLCIYKYIKIQIKD